MSWNDDVERAFARRREELLAELVADGARIAAEAAAIVDAVAASHPLAYVGAGVAAGALLTMAPASALPAARVNPRRSWSRSRRLWRVWRFGAQLLG
jgi:hypothetical protein